MIRDISRAALDGESTTADEDNEVCPKCESIHPVHTISDLSDGSWHEVKDGSTTIIPDPFKKEIER